MMMVLPPLLLLILILLLSSPSLFSSAADTLTPSQTLADNGQTLVSASQTFELGFFSPWNSANRYVGIWFKNVQLQTPVWVANKQNPLTDSSSGVLTIDINGNILVTDNRTKIVLWSSNSSSANGVLQPNYPIMQILDTGNLVVKVNNSANYQWQSFDYPCDTLIPGMKLGWDLRANREWYITSWTSLQDPSPGPYTYRVDPRGLPQIVLRRGDTVTFRSGPWDGVRFGGAPALGPNRVFTPHVVFDDNEVYYSFENNDNSIVSRFVVNQSGLVEHLTWSGSSNQWLSIATMHTDGCDDYETCGPYGICRIANGQPFCTCPEGFRPNSTQDWERLVWFGGCVPKVPVNCSLRQGFKQVSGLKLPDSSHFLVDETATNRDQCSDACLGNCSCVAFAKTEISGCVVWFGNLIDMRYFDSGGQDLYIRMDASQLGSSNKTKKRAIIASVSSISGVLLLGLAGWFVLWRRRTTTARKRRDQRLNDRNQDNNQSSVEENLELPLFDLGTISAATNKFSYTNKIGEGGFGPVYKGVLSTGQEIAVKRLSKESGQGLREFKNEVILYSKLQHRNLVRLLGCCIDGEERVLIYEYLPNKSLDLVIFNQTRGTSLDWGKRFDIIVGIARGILYLHRDSRLRIIHRDLKATNILLDGEMNPKISDFGLARTFGGDQSQENTNRVIGTYGYMSPEYAIDGVFSVKSDVFSFGVLVLEIVSGTKNRGFYHPDHDLNLLGHAWKLWNEGKPMKLVDPVMESPVNTSDTLLRCIHVGLLCVQQRPEDRPTMSSVLLMLDSENPVLPQPKQPGFYTERFPVDTDSSSTAQKPPPPSNEVTVTLLQGR